MTCPPGGDIFQYHAELQEQIKIVKTQAEVLEVKATVSPLVENALLLIAAWENPKFQKMALEFTMDDKAVSGNDLVRELQKQQLLTNHLNQNRGRQSHQSYPRHDGNVRVHVASTPNPSSSSKKPTGVYF